ncbi:hypothetical protein RCJ22_07955 [Vibrio sp. FNV 38]|nr:hypothetical protein [Vibrio sp. FNV 38]
MSDQDWKSMIRFLEVLPKSGDKELALLKAHLLIEDVLTQIIRKNCINERYVNEARLQFHQKIKLVRAFNEIHGAEWVWKALQLLNQARNHMSHNLTELELDVKVGTFTEYVELNTNKLFEQEENDKFSDFHMAAFNVYIPLAVYANFEPKTSGFKTLLTS